MRNAIILFFVLLFVGPAFGQAPEKLFVGNCSFSGFSLLSDSTYRGNITRFDDRMGDGYNLTQLAVGYEIFDGRGLVFTIDTIHTSTNFTANVSVTAKIDRGFEPFGSGQVYQPTANGLIPPSSQEQAGLSPTQKARIDRHNVVVMQSLIGGRDSVYSITNVPDTSSLSPVMGDIFINAAGDTMGVYSTSWVLFFGGGGDNLGDHTATTDLDMDGNNIQMSGGYVIGGTLAGSDLVFQTTTGAGDGGSDVIFLNGNNGASESVRIKGDGDVGIGTDTPLQKLHVAGTARITGSDGTPTALMGRDGDGDIGVVSLGNGLTLTTGTLAANDTVTTLLQDSILVYSVAGVETGRDTISVAGTGGGGGLSGSGTTNRTALWTAATTLGDSYLLQSASALTLDANKMFVNVGGTTASRPAATAGGHWFNTSDLRPQWSDGVSWYNYSPWQRLSSNEISWTDGTPEMSISNNGIEFYPDGTVDVTEAYGVGYQLGVSASSTFFSGGAGYQLGYGNTGTRFSGGVGYRLGYLNTGAYFSGGAGVGLGQQNTGANFSGGAGYLLGFGNAGNNFSGGAGYALGNANTGANFSGGAGYQLGQSNTGTNFSGGAGYLLGFQNTGIAFSGGAGDRLGYQNTGANFSGGAGQLLGYLNSGDFVSGGAGAYCLYWNGGDYAAASGAYAAYLNEGSYITTVGAESLYGNSKDSLTAIGYRAGYFQEDVTKLDTFIQSNRLTNDTIKINGSTAKWGAVGDIVPLFTTRLGAANYTPIGLQKYQITSDSTIKCLLATSATSNSELVKIAIGLQYSNATLVGAFAQPDKDNQIVLGNSAVEEIKLGPGRLRSDNFSIAKQGWIYEYSEAKEALVLAPNPVQVRQNASYYEETVREYTLGSGADSIITVDTLTLAIKTDSISATAGLIENLKSDTVRWQVRYDFYYLSDEDACFALLDLTTDGTETPAAIPGSAARGEQVSLNGGQMPGRTCLVDVPPGQKIRLCVKGSVGVATSMDISYLTITINEINRE